MSGAPTIPRELVYLGDAVELDSDTWEWKWNKSDRVIVATDPGGRRIYLFKKDRPVKNPKCRLGMRIQSLMFDRNLFNQTQAKRWLKRYGAEIPKVDATEAYLHYRQEPDTHFSFFRTDELSRGVKAVYGCPKEKWAKNPSKAENLFKRFNRRKSRSKDVMDCPNPTKRVGRAIHIVYRSGKFGKPTGYIHQFETKPIVWTDNPNRPQVLVLTGGKIRVTKRGIEG